MEPWPVSIRTDSQYALDGVWWYHLKLRHTTWRGQRPLIVSLDLWKTLDTLLEARPADEVLFTKVRAHATAKNVPNRLIMLQDFAGNSAADSCRCVGRRAC